MTLRIEKANDNAAPTIRLIGRIRSEHLDALRMQLENCPKRAAIDLAEVTNLDVEAVRFLGARELEGFHLLNCVPFIREWIHRERETQSTDTPGENSMEISQASIAGEGTIESAGGLRIFFRSWRPSATARGVVVIIPGFNSHSGYYTWVGTQLASQDLAVYAVDLRGRGKSDGERFFVDKFADYISDVAALLTLAKSRGPGLPVFLLGHSAGGVLACLYALDRPGELTGLISESFAFQTPAPDFVLAVLKGLSHVAPHAHVLHLNNEDFSRDPSVVEMMNGDPLIAHETQPTETVAELVRADERLKNEFPNLVLPLLILHGTADKVAKPGGSQLFNDAAGSTDKTLRLYDGSFHDPLNDLDKQTVMRDIQGWIASRLSQQKSHGGIA